jgi:hypothetical protein
MPSGAGALVLVLGGALEEARACWAAARARYPGALVVGCSTAGQICGEQVCDDAITVTAISFAETRLRLASAAVSSPEESASAGRRLMEALVAPDLRHVLLFSDGLRVNGSALLAGLAEAMPAGVSATGGLAADGDRFAQTWTLADAPPAEGQVVAVGLYGARLRIGCGSRGGWDPFGPERLVTRSEGNVLYTLDDVSALALYRRYLGEFAAGLPSAALRFPLSLRGPDGAPGLVRTILGMDEARQSLRFAGDLPQGSYVRFMKANPDRLVDGAHAAAQESCAGAATPHWALLVSCVGRRLVLRQRVEEELEGARDALGAACPMSGFYSYGEICPAFGQGGAVLHNQTMTITCFWE